MSRLDLPMARHRTILMKRRSVQSIHSSLPDFNDDKQKSIIRSNEGGGQQKMEFHLLKFPFSEVFPYGMNSKKFIDDLRKIARISELVAQEPLTKDFALKYKRTWKKKKGQKIAYTVNFGR